MQDALVIARPQPVADVADDGLRAAAVNGAPSGIADGNKPRRTLGWQWVT